MIDSFIAKNKDSSIIKIEENIAKDNIIEENLIKDSSEVNVST